MAHGYEYGNTRLRARHAALLGRVDLDRMIGRDVDGVVGLLARTGWRESIEEASTRFAGVRLIHEAARRYLGAMLRGVPPLYAGSARAQVDALLSVWDRRNLVALLRASARQRPSDEAVAFLVPAGSLDDAALRVLALADDPKALIDQLVTWGVPGGRELLAAWPAWRETADLTVLERAVVGAWAAGFEARRHDLDALIADTLAGDLARDEVMLAVRLRAARESGEELVASPEWIGLQDLPGGLVRRQDLWDFVRLPARTEAVRVLVGRPGLARWELPLRRWAATGDIVGLGEDLDRDLHARRAGGRYHADPLGPGPIVAYADAVETEVRNVRAIAAGLVAGLDREAIRSHVWEA